MPTQSLPPATLELVRQEAQRCYTDPTLLPEKHELVSSFAPPDGDGDDPRILIAATYPNGLRLVRVEPNLDLAADVRAIIAGIAGLTYLPEHTCLWYRDRRRSDRALSRYARELMRAFESLALDDIAVRWIVVEPVASPPRPPYRPNPTPTTERAFIPHFNRNPITGRSNWRRLTRTEREILGALVGLHRIRTGGPFVFQDGALIPSIGRRVQRRTIEGLCAKLMLESHGPIPGVYRLTQSAMLGLEGGEQP